LLYLLTLSIICKYKYLAIPVYRVCNQWTPTTEMEYHIYSSNLNYGSDKTVLQIKSQALEL